jgi:putative nucleotidyltransferase with HDIG domain
MDSTKEQSLLLHSNELRVGMFVHIELGWMDHPFALNRFRIANAQQLADIQGLKLKQIRVVPSRSDPNLFPDNLLNALNMDILADVSLNPNPPSSTDQGLLVAIQKASLAQCDKSFSDASTQWQSIMADVLQNPLKARLECNQMLGSFLHQTTSEHDTHIRLLSESAGESLVLHALNVTVISLLLGRALGLSESELEDLGMAALLHDVGKLKLPQRVQLGIHLSASQESLSRTHIQLSTDVAKSMGLSAGVLTIISQHHEYADGSGYPKGLTASAMTRAAHILSLVNVYDNLSNNNNSMLSLTPHEAMTMLFAQRKLQFESSVLQAFVELMGVYPPGSVVQLSDERFAMVVASNAKRPNKPSVLIYDSQISAEHAAIVALQDVPNLSIRRSLQYKSLPPAVLSYLSPRKRTCYFFENSANAETLRGTKQ